MPENGQNNGLDNSLPPKTPIAQIQANTDYSLRIIREVLKPNTVEQGGTAIRAREALSKFQANELHELRVAFKE